MAIPSYRRSVCLTLMQISETAKGLSDEFRNSHADMNWHKVKGFRMFVAHKYHELQFSKAWDIVEEDIPTLKEFCLREIESLAERGSPEDGPRGRSVDGGARACTRLSDPCV